MHRCERGLKQNCRGAESSDIVVYVHVECNESSVALSTRDCSLEEDKRVEGGASHGRVARELSGAIRLQSILHDCARDDTML